MRSRLKRLERAAREEMIEIPQRDGTVTRFPLSALPGAFTSSFDRMGAGEDAPPEHPLVTAARNSSDPEWSGSFYAASEPEEWTRPVEGLSK